MITCNDLFFFLFSLFFSNFHLRHPSFVIFSVSPFSRNEMNNNNICCHGGSYRFFYITLFIPGLSFISLSFFRSLTISHSHSHLSLTGMLP